MTLRAKLLLAQAPILAALLLLSVLHLWSVSAVGGAAQSILRENYRSVLAAQRMEDALERMDSSALFLLTGQRDKAQLQLEANRKRFEIELRVEEGNITEPGEMEATAVLRQRWRDYQQRVDSLFTVKAVDEARLLYFSATEPAFRSVKAAADDILSLNQDAMVRKSDHARRLAERVSQIAALSALAAVVLGFLASLVLTARLLRPLLVFAMQRAVWGGNHDARAEVRGHDEIRTWPRTSTPWPSS